MAAAVLLTFAAILTFVPLQSGSVSSLFGCAFGRDLVTRHDQGGNIRYDNDRGPDCSSLGVIGPRLAATLIAALIGAAALRLPAQTHLRSGE